MQILDGEIIRNEMNKSAQGGTERIVEDLVKSLPIELLKEFQIVVSRLRGELRDDKFRIFYAHDLAGDPESDHLRHGGWKKYHRLVFVSHWQRDQYIRTYNIPFSKCVVIQNSITPIMAHKTVDSEIKLIYNTTPHRGLELLVPVFERLCEQWDNIHLDVFSSFNAYGWGQRDEPYQKIFQRIKDHDKMTYHGFRPNEVVRDYLAKAHIFAYPSIWQETSCLALMEAMSAECICVHSDFGALPETSANWTMMYGYHEDPMKHAGIFHHILQVAIEAVAEKNEATKIKLKGQKSYVDLFYNSNIKNYEWEAFLSTIIHEPKEFPKEKELFEYNITT